MTHMNELAVVTGASTGIGFELAKCAAEDGYDLIIAADEPEIETASVQLRGLTRNVKAVQAEHFGHRLIASPAHGRQTRALMRHPGQDQK